jgi:hypothetical protein
MHVTLLADFVKNIGFDRNEIFNRTGGLDLEAETRAYQLRANVGNPTIQRFGDWFAFGGYKYLQRDSVLDAFNDGDFYLGGTNAKGWFMGGGYGVSRDAWLSLKYTTANEVDGLPLSINTLMIDFNARF